MAAGLVKEHALVDAVEAKQSIVVFTDEILSKYANKNDLELIMKR